jgi:hypothetical protein
MATWPSGNKPVTTTTDADSDSISGARADLNKTVANQIEIIDTFNIPASPTNDHILVFNSSTGQFDVEANTAGFSGDLNGTDLTDSAGELDIVNSRVNVKPNTSDDRKISMGDELFTTSNYPLTSHTISGAEERWAFLFLDEHSAGTGLPKSIGGGNFTNPTIAGRVQGGTPGNEVGVKSGGRLISFQAFAGQDDDGAGTNYTLPTSANFRILGETTQVQRTSGNGGRGTKLRFDTIADDSQSSTISMDMQGDSVRITPGGNGNINCGGDLNIKANFGNNPVTITKRAFVYHSDSYASSFTPDADDGDWIKVDATGAIDIAVPTNFASGQRIHLMVKNTSGGNLTPTFAAAYIGLGSGGTIGNNNRSLYAIENWNSEICVYQLLNNVN